ncbi:MAG TPA: translation elongation factor Ts [Gaiellaceae bacterium]|nr:translation elongation factor Ts [Gaiellaceae bacterium]
MSQDVPEIPASLVKELRDSTGAGFMECKRALVEAKGDLDEAERIIRERGLAAARKRAGRTTPEGKVLARIDNGRGAIVAVGSETEPVSSNEEFLSFAERVIAAVENGGPDAVTKLEQERVDLIARIGENIEVVGAARLEAENDEVLAAYVHPPAQKIGVLVRAEATPELARLVAMHISFASPRFLTRSEVPADEVEAERSILEKLPDLEGKPEQVREKIIEGRLAKGFFAETVLDDQPWIHDPGLTVGQALAEHGAEVRDFVRYALG